MALSESFCLDCWKSVTIAHCDMCSYRIKLHLELEEAVEFLQTNCGWIMAPGAHDPTVTHWVCPHCNEHYH